jgi:hypothetical protein
MSVTRKQIMNELEMELDKTELGRTKDNFKSKCDEVVAHWKDVARMNLDRGYATGEYRDSIHRESIRATRAEGGNAGGWKSRAVTFDEIAHLLEYGTGPDQDGVGSWFSIKDNRWHTTPNTPTPAFGIAAEVENDMNSTFAKQGRKRRRQASYEAIDRGKRPTNQQLFAEWEANNPEDAAEYAARRARRT